MLLEKIYLKNVVKDISNISKESAHMLIHI